VCALKPFKGCDKLETRLRGTDWPSSAGSSKGGEPPKWSGKHYNVYLRHEGASVGIKQAQDGALAGLIQARNTEQRQSLNRLGGSVTEDQESTTDVTNCKGLSRMLRPKTNVRVAGYTAPRELLTAGDAAATSVGNASWHQLTQVT
jgi:hypothetical protein